MSPIRRILSLWRGHFAYLGLGALLALAALAAGIALMANAGRFIAVAVTGGILLVPIILQATGTARVLLRYTERVVSHDAMFRALTSIRIWFFSGLAHSAAGGLGFRKAGDVLARLVNDVEALDGLYLRIIVPGLGAVLLLPLLTVFLWRESIWAAILILPIFAFIAFILPLRAARLAASNTGQTGIAMSALRSAALGRADRAARSQNFLPRKAGCWRKSSRRKLPYLAAQRDFSRQSSRLNTTSFLAAQAATLLAILLALIITGASPLAAVIAVFVLIAAFEATAGLPRAGILFGQAQDAAAPRCCSSDHGATRARPGNARGTSQQQRTGLRTCQLPLCRQPALCFRKPVAAAAKQYAHGHPRSLRRRQVHHRGVTTETGGAGCRPHSPWPHRYRCLARRGPTQPYRLSLAIHASVRRHHPQQSAPRRSHRRRCQALGSPCRPRSLPKPSTHCPTALIPGSANLVIRSRAARPGASRWPAPCSRRPPS